MKLMTEEAMHYDTIGIFTGGGCYSETFDRILLLMMQKEKKTEIWCGTREKFPGAAAYLADMDVLKAGVEYRSGLQNMERIPFAGNVFLPQAEAWPATVTQLVKGAGVSGRRVWQAPDPAQIFELHPDLISATNVFVIFPGDFDFEILNGLGRNLTARAALGPDVVDEILYSPLDGFLVPNRIANRHIREYRL